MPNAEAASTPPARALAESAAKFFAEGQSDEARALFAQALTPDTTDLRILFLAFQFHFRSGELDEAEKLVRRRLAVAGPDTDSEDTARAYTNLGLVLQYKGDFDGAEREYTRSVEISRRIGSDYALARALGNLGILPETRGDLDRAEDLFRQALAIAERIGADDLVASKLANLGDVMLARGRPADARDFWARAVALFTRLGDTKHHAEFSQKLAALDQAAPSSGTA